MVFNYLITGSNRGLGFEIANLAYQDGNNVIGHARNIEKLNISSLKKILKLNITAELKNYDETFKNFNSISTAGHTVKTLVCNAGKSSYSNNDLKFLDDAENALSENFFVTLNTIKACINADLGIENIICISSICGTEEIRGAPVAYSFAKASLNSFVKMSAVYFAKKNIRINVISPGNLLFEGSVWQKKLDKDPLIVDGMLKENVALARFGIPENIYKAIKYLANDATFTTGSNLIIDGGQVNKW